MAKVKKIPDFPDYEISASGEVFSSKRRERVQLSPSTATGYAKVCLTNGKEKGFFHVHRLVAQAFIRNPSKKLLVNHIDGNKLNNDVTNLEWSSHKDNSKHYSEKLAPRYTAERKMKKESDMKTRMAILNYAHSSCTTNPGLFYAIYKTVMES